MPATINRTEKTILLMLSYGKKHRQIAKQLKLTPDEIAANIAAAIRKLKAKGQIHTMMKALRRRLVPRAATLKRFGSKHAPAASARP